MNGLNSSFGLAKQTDRDTKATTNFIWLLATDTGGGPQPRVRQLPAEMGGGLLSRGMLKTGVNGAAAWRGVPRPESLGLILYGLAGNVVSAEQDPDTTPASGDEYYQHVFTIGADPADTPYFTARRGISNSFGEEVTGARLAGLTLNMRALNYVTGQLALDGIEPDLVADVSGWNPDPDGSPAFVASESSIKLTAADTIDTFPVRAATLAIGNAHEIDGEFIIGKKTPRDIDVIGRSVGLTCEILVQDKDLYQKLMYDPAGVSTSWLAKMFESAEVDFTFTAAEDIAGMTLTPVPYSLEFTASKTQWSAAPIGLRGTDIVVVQLSGMVVQPGVGSEPFTLTLNNSTASYA